MTKRLFLVIAIACGVIFVPYWVGNPFVIANTPATIAWLGGVCILVSIAGTGYILTRVVIWLYDYIRTGTFLLLAVCFLVGCGEKKVQPTLIRLQQIIPVNAWGSTDGQQSTWKQAADSSTFMCIVHEVAYGDDRTLYNYHLIKLFYRDLEKDSLLYNFTSVLYRYADAQAANQYSFNDDDSIPGLQQKTEIRARNAMRDFFKYDIYLDAAEHDNFIWTTLKVKLKQ